MARYTGPACKLCRREGTKLFLKGERCVNGKCSLDGKRSHAPGQHGADGFKRQNKGYGKMLREKQKTKRYYGIQEKQFRSYFDSAKKAQGVTGENLLSLLERRLDNVVYRMGMAESRRDARQMVLHGHFRLNGNKVNIPSLIVNKGDVISLKETSRDTVKVKGLIEALDGKNIPKWIDLNKTEVSATISELPVRDDVDLQIAEHLIVELYTK